MNHRIAILSLVTAFAALDCAADDAALNAETGSDGSDLAIARVPSPARDSQRLYVGGLNFSHVQGGRNDYWVFASKGGAPFTVNAVAYDDGGEPDGAQQFALDLYYLSSNRWRHYEATNSDSGSATLDATSRTARLWMLRIAADTNPYVIQMYVNCASGDHACAYRAQPGDACTAASDHCDRGLFCQFASACGTDGSAGACAQPTRSNCSPAGFVCGCDGTQYDNACDAQAAGTSVASEGTCGGAAGTCDPTVWANANMTAGTLTHDSWTSSDHVFSYTFGGTGSLTAVYDRCASSGPIHCELAAQQRTGSWSVANDGSGVVTLTYDDGTAATLQAQRNCSGDTQLTGTDWNTTVAVLGTYPAMR